MASLPASALTRVLNDECWGSCMFDILILVLGTGGILLMAAYAALCDRI